MLSPLVESLLRLLSATGVTDFFLILLFGLFFWASYNSKQGKHVALTNYAPTMLTSIGILGTFVGIIVGLLGFNPDDIDGSITVLLNGLKIAFITSIFGMFLSILYKVLYTSGWITPKQSEEFMKDEVGIEDIYGVMKRQEEALQKLQKSISENDESSLVGQMKLMRSDFSDNHKRMAMQLDQTIEPLKLIQEHVSKQQEKFDKFTETLWIKLQDFADMLSKSATEQVINALKDVIRDFNEKLTEQFGENFKELNAAVIKLVDWQENYKQQLGDMKTQFDHSVQAMSASEQSLGVITENTQAIPEHIGHLQEVITVNQHQLQELGRHLDAFAAVRDRAVEAVPQIREQVDLTLNGVKEAGEKLATGLNESTAHMTSTIIAGAEEFQSNVQATNAAVVETASTLTENSEKIREQLDATVVDMNKHVREMVEHLQANSKSVADEFKATGTEFMQQIAQVQQSFNQNLEHMRSDMQSSMEQLSQEQSRQLQRVLEGLEQTVTRSLTKTGESVQNQLNMMDEIAGREIESIMNGMGSALARISNQFTSDYQRLVQAMDQVIRTQSRV